VEDDDSDKDGNNDDDTDSNDKINYRNNVKDYSWIPITDEPCIHVEVETWTLVFRTGWLKTVHLFESSAFTTTHLLVPGLPVSTTNTSQWIFVCVCVYACVFVCVCVCVYVCVCVCACGIHVFIMYHSGLLLTRAFQCPKIWDSCKLH
jgi:hypothetical protein